ncbi:MAG TPA: glycosyltransferase [Sphingobacteriaceae bacterium]
MTSIGKYEIVRWKDPGSHVAQEVVREFENTFQQCTDAPVRYSGKDWYLKILNRTLKILYIQKNSGLPLPAVSDNPVFAILMGNEFEKCLLQFLPRQGNVVYFFDAWPKYHADISRFIRSFHVHTVFFSSKQVTEIFRKANTGSRCYWLPEAINVKAFRCRPYTEKTIDVLQFGRRYDLYHQQIAGPLEEQGYCYLYEKRKGQVVFPTNDEFIEGLSRSRISICFPCNMTHPDRSGGISTMTVRYLQSMASKCLIVGTMPAEMRELFEYDPVIEVDLRDPAGQLLSILRNYHQYIPLIEKNYAAVRLHHTWDHRCEAIMDILNTEKDTAGSLNTLTSIQ